MIFIWLGILVALLLIELITHNVITIWYSFSALISLILSLFIKSYLIEFLVFIVLGTILVLTLRDKVIEKYGKKN